LIETWVGYYVGHVFEAAMVRLRDFSSSPATEVDGLLKVRDNSRSSPSLRKHSLTFTRARDFGFSTLGSRHGVLILSLMIDDADRLCLDPFEWTPSRTISSSISTCRRLSQSVWGYSALDSEVEYSGRLSEAVPRPGRASLQKEGSKERWTRAKRCRSWDSSEYTGLIFMLAFTLT
jgi:hypothetical protein